MQTTAGNATTPLVSDSDTKYKESKQRSRCLVISFLCLIVIVVAVVIIIVVVIGTDGSESTAPDWRMEFIQLPSNTTARNNSQYLTQFPHLAGSPQNHQYAEYLRDKLQSFGFNTSLIQYDNIYLGGYVYSSLKQLNSSDPLSPILREFDLSEAMITSDPTSDTEQRSHAYNGFAATGNVTATLIYVNYGSRKDFLRLTALGYNLSGMIGIVKYGGGMFRGEKSLEAETFGMVGLLIYSDPLDYGPLQGAVFPAGPWLPSTGYQRGSIIAGYYCPGNPSPQRLMEKCNRSREEFMPQIPVIPIGSRNAFILMSQLNGMLVNETWSDLDDGPLWQGGFNFSYRIGGRFGADSSMEVVLNLNVINNNQDTSTITNVVGFIKGTKYPNEAIIIGNHYDAWIYGAADPISGVVTSLEIARSLGELMEMGWQPLRSIYIAYWDGEEQCLIGSTAFGEENAEMLQNELVAYMNIDTAASGPNINARSDPTLSKFMIDGLRYIDKPYEDDMDLYEDWLSRQAADTSLQTYTIGYGSDYVVFVEHLGLPAMHAGFAGNFGTYHSVYDSFAWISETIDPQYKIHVALAQYVGLLVLDLLTNMSYFQACVGDLVILSLANC